MLKVPTRATQTDSWGLFPLVGSYCECSYGSLLLPSTYIHLLLVIVDVVVYNKNENLSLLCKSWSVDIIYGVKCSAVKKKAFSF
jgi:hypothetical protein